jgi:hypothetical protein
VKDKLRGIPPHTLITAVAAVAWLASFIIRAFVPDFALGTAADALMTTCVGYWFTANHKAGDGGDLLGAVVSKNVLPAISGAHAPSKPPLADDGPPIGTYPKPSPQPAPKSAPPKQGGLPWGS